MEKWLDTLTARGDYRIGGILLAVMAWRSSCREEQVNKEEEK
jgi:hypothetical protein